VTFRRALGAEARLKQGAIMHKAQAATQAHQTSIETFGSLQKIE
jgi:hypothetical protein